MRANVRLGVLQKGGHREEAISLGGRVPKWDAGLSAQQAGGRPRSQDVRRRGQEGQGAFLMGRRQPNRKAVERARWERQRRAAIKTEQIERCYKQYTPPQIARAKP